jgi:hypothetical protein
MRRSRRPHAFRVIVAFLAVSILLMLIGQTMALVDYDQAVRMGLQESLEEVSAFGIAVNRAIGAADTVVYIPLLVVSLVGLLLGKRWALLTTAAAFGVSAYWAGAMSFLLWSFLPGVPGYTLEAGLEYVAFLAGYILFGVWGLVYLVLRGDALLR